MLVGYFLGKSENCRVGDFHFWSVLTDNQQLFRSLGWETRCWSKKFNNLKYFEIFDLENMTSPPEPPSRQLGTPKE